MRLGGKGVTGAVRRWPTLPVVLFALGVAAAFAAGSPGTTAASWWVAVATDQLNLRAEPGEWSEIVGQAWGGEWVEVLDGPAGDGWYRVRVGERAGWASGAYLDLDGSGGTGGVAAWGERWVDIDRSSQTVTLFEGETPVATYWGAMGSDGSADGFFSTAIGTHYVYEKTEGLSWTDYGGGFITHWVGFDPNRLNGFHSYLLDENGWPVPGGDGPTGGCVALAPGAAEHLYGFVGVGTRVEVHW